MTTFDITHDGTTYTLDLRGGASSGGQVIGTWSTAADGSVIVHSLATSGFGTSSLSPPSAAAALGSGVVPSVPVAPQTSGTDASAEATGTSTADSSTDPADAASADGPATLATVPVTWRWNASNQLCIDDASGQELINLNTTGLTPAFLTRDAVLYVRPDLSHIFTVQLQPTWGLDASHDLTMTLGGVSSSINGFVQDERSRFIYHFFDKDDVSIFGVLGFVGSWHQYVDDAGVSRLEFRYLESDGSTETFTLPGSAVIDRSTNQFIYSYDKDDRTYSIKLIGFLRINDDFTVTYSLDRQTSRTGAEQVASTTFVVRADFARHNLVGNLELKVRKDDGSSGSTVLTIGGSMTAVLGAVQLHVGFAFSQVRNGSSVTSTIAFQGSLSWHGGSVQWTFTHNALTSTLTISASDIEIGRARVDSRLNLVTANGELKGVQALFGISF